jgi:BolA protein
MTDVATVLRERLAGLHPVVIEITDDSARHVGHAGAANGARHFSVMIVSEAFSGLPRVKRHERVYRQVGDLLPYPIHALSIKALAPEELPS